jgi:chemotaxis protein histidine kinase CheA
VNGAFGLVNGFSADFIYAYLCFVKFCKIFLVLVTFILSSFVFAQNTNEVKSIQAPQQKLEHAISIKSESLEAESYVNLGDFYLSQNNLPKSEAYYLKAKQLYEKLKDEKNLSAAARKLAHAQERQNKVTAAAASYDKAASAAASKYQTVLNSNDATRLRSTSLESKKKAVHQNIKMNVEYLKSEELSQDYQNMAEINVQQNNIPAATKNLENAYELSKKEEPAKALEINRKTVDLLVEEKFFDKAIATKKEALNEDFVQENSQEKVTQIQELADIYLKSNDTETAVKLLQNSYKLALKENHTVEAHRSLMKLDSLFAADGNPEKSIPLYKNFLSTLPTLLTKDSSLGNLKMMKDIEIRIAQLEKEKSLQEQLLKRRNLFNYLLIGGLFLALCFILYALLMQKKLRIQNKRIELQSLRREMNPHFIFNSLNSVNQFIAENNELEANQYLTRFSKLMRGVMENSKDDFIPLGEELDLLKNYLALEKSRFHDKFDYEIEVDPELKGDHILIPGMLIQPFLENAVWHGLRYRTDAGNLQLSFKKSEGHILVTVKDNGIGIQKSKEQKTVHQKQRNGRGMKNTLERISLLNDLYRRNITCSVDDRNGEGGVLVTLKMKLN